MSEAKSQKSCFPERFCRETMDELYVRYNRRELVHPDPLEFLYDYADPRDREVVGLIASALAYGRVAQVLGSVSKVLGRMGESPSRFVTENSHEGLRRALADFKHRFTTGEELAALLWGVKGAIKKYGSLQSCFMAGLSGASGTVLPALASFVHVLGEKMGPAPSMLLPSPAGGSACKRLNLFLRWMVRRDAVDPGGWTGVSPAMLIVPLDVHMHKVGIGMKLTQRKQADLRTAVEMTEAFRTIAPSDPVRYDFALTRPGIRERLDGW